MSKCLAVKTAENVLEPTAQANSVATALKVAELQKKMAHGLLYNTEEIIIESGTYTAPVDGWYEVTVINGGTSGNYYRWGVNHRVMGGDSGAFVKRLAFLLKGQQIPVEIGAGGVCVDGVDGMKGSGPGGISSFGDITTESDEGLANICHGTLQQGVYASDDLVCAGGGFGGANWSSPASWYGGGGSIQALKNGVGITTPNGYQGAVILRYYDPDKDSVTVTPENL